MRTMTGTALAGGALLLGGMLMAPSFTAAQAPPAGRGPRAERSAASSQDPVARLMAYDKNGDGKLSREELSDDRLADLFRRTDADKDGFVTQQELTGALAASGGGPSGRRRTGRIMGLATYPPDPLPSREGGVLLRLLPQEAEHTPMSFPPGKRESLRRELFLPLGKEAE